MTKTQTKPSTKRRIDPMPTATFIGRCMIQSSNKHWGAHDLTKEKQLSMALASLMAWCKHNGVDGATAKADADRLFVKMLSV
jgi:hypothetical protein